ncbi:hypothetical protein [Bilophila wadsworthia]|uniref:hypothetical protein n=1 Tax=Bilophila wadsworthia TaxID=35833 RepID=UPI0028484A81|nr:hypothetical protein [Bilophila sp.]
MMWLRRKSSGTVSGARIPSPSACAVVSPRGACMGTPPAGCATGEDNPPTTPCTGAVGMDMAGPDGALYGVTKVRS